MYLHPEDQLATFHAAEREAHEAAAYQRLALRAATAKRREQWRRWSTKAADHLAQRPRASRLRAS